MGIWPLLHSQHQGLPRDPQRTRCHQRVWDRLAPRPDRSRGHFLAGTIPQVPSGQKPCRDGCSNTGWGARGFPARRHSESFLCRTSRKVVMKRGHKRKTVSPWSCANKTTLNDFSRIRLQSSHCACRCRDQRDPKLYKNTKMIF